MPFVTNITEGTYSFIYCDAGDPGIRANNRGGAGTAGNPVQVGNTTFMRFIKCQLHIITMLLYPHKLLILLNYLDNICWWRCQCRLIRNASIVCYPLALELSAKDF